MVIIRVYDCFTFFNELEILELRLNLLNEVVDYFVLVEANKTHKNDDKDFIFENNKHLFEEFIDKIIYIKVEDMPSYDHNNEWKLENYQRNCITRGLNGSNHEDIIFISDIDEIPNPNVIRLLNNNKIKVKFCTRDRLQKNIVQLIRFPECLLKHHGMKLLERTPLALEQSLFYYFVNCKCKEVWNGSIITKAKNLSTPQKLRDRRNKLPRIKNGGWHFSYLGGVEKILIKLKSIVEAPSYNISIDYIRNCVNNGLDIYGRKGKAFEYEFIDICKSLPLYVTCLIKKYPHLYFDSTENIQHKK